jgi:hypothetical protein
MFDRMSKTPRRNQTGVRHAIDIERKSKGHDNLLSPAKCQSRLVSSHGFLHSLICLVIIKQAVIQHRILQILWRLALKARSEAFQPLYTDIQFHLSLSLHSHPFITCYKRFCDVLMKATFFQPNFRQRLLNRLLSLQSHLPTSPIDI